ncbi:hypothetical protein [Nocardia sp. NPDC058705]|uniref:hypothetical protein n=1 Tax=Nocardia sp. NPDC058705 TaxID=3346609 RepID=UPI0036CA08EA
MRAAHRRFGEVDTAPALADIDALQRQHPQDNHHRLVSVTAEGDYGGFVEVRRHIVGGVATVAVVAAAAVLACANRDSGSGQRMPAQLASAPTCLAPNVVSAVLPSQPRPVTGVPSAPEPGSIPSDFQPTSVVICEFAGDIPPDNPVQQIARETHRTGDLAPVVATLSQPSATRSDECTVSAVPAPAVWMVNRHGAAVWVELPATSCGLPQPEVMDAVNGLQIIKTIDHTIGLLP